MSRNLLICFYITASTHIPDTSLPTIEKKIKTLELKKKLYWEGLVL